MFGWLHASCREERAAERQAAADRERALLAEIRDLTDKLTVLADTKAHLALHPRDPAPRPEDPGKPRPEVPLPAWVNRLSGGHHINLGQIRKDIQGRRRPAMNGNAPPAVKE